MEKGVTLFQKHCIILFHIYNSRPYWPSFGKATHTICIFFLPFCLLQMNIFFHSDPRLIIILYTCSLYICAGHPDVDLSIPHWTIPNDLYRSVSFPCWISSCIMLFTTLQVIWSSTICWSSKACYCKVLQATLDNPAGAIWSIDKILTRLPMLNISVREKNLASRAGTG